MLEDANKLNLAQLAELEASGSQYTTNRTAPLWIYRNQLRDILERKQINVIYEMLHQRCTNAIRSEVEPMKDVVRLVRRHFKGVVAWIQIPLDQQFH